MKNPKPKVRKVAWVVGFVVVVLAAAVSGPHWPTAWHFVSMKTERLYWPDGSLGERRFVNRWSEIIEGLEVWWPNGVKAFDRDSRSSWNLDGRPVSIDEYKKLLRKTMERQGMDTSRRTEHQANIWP